MGSISSRSKLAAVVTAAATLPLAACDSIPNVTPVSFATEVQTRGYIIDEAALADLKPGTDVQAVLRTMGTPSTVSTVGNKTFYYISQTTEQRFRFTNPRVTDQRVIAVYFDPRFKVQRVANYGMQDGVVFDFISRTTPTAGAEQSFIGNLFRGMSGSQFNPFGA